MRSNALRLNAYYKNCVMKFPRPKIEVSDALAEKGTSTLLYSMGAGLAQESVEVPLQAKSMSQARIIAWRAVFLLSADIPARAASWKISRLIVRVLA